MFKKNKPQISSPATGESIKLTEVPDPVFAEKVLGDGVGINPSSGEIVSPVDGTIAQVAHTFHAIGIEADDGLEVLVHIGIDTVKLGGEGFTCHVEVGQKVKRGDKLMDVDFGLIRSKGFSPISPCIITNMDALDSFEPQYGEVAGGETPVISYKLK